MIRFVIVDIYVVLLLAILNTESLSKELELAADDVQFHHRQGSFKTWNAKETSQRLEALQNCLDVYFKLALDVRSS